jgi:hypothetical protein
VLAVTDVITYPYPTMRPGNALKVGLSATLGEEPEVEVALV